MEDKSSRIVKRLDKLNEFDREPVDSKHLQGGRHFAGVFAGEHVAATEFVIGALFVSQGARTCDVIVGLIFGNLLAVLSWALICSPIAVDTRLTLYWYLRRIGGPIVTLIYNVFNAVLYCILAGAMITVAASAVRIPFGIPAQVGWFPTDIRFVFVVLGVGAVVVTLAILGFKKLAEFAEMCSPWMFLMFICGALVLMPTIVASVGEVSAINSFYDFWRVADAAIWPGPAQGQESGLGFLHIVFFSWICNQAMHLGLSDMALLRYAKRSSYGFYSAFGMYLGHFLAWVCAGVMGAGAALIIGKPLVGLDSGSVAFTALGTMGALAVVIAGWTTSNPTIYRAGLAFQAVTPNWPRWLVTLLAGAVTTIIACSPFVFTKLLNFVGIYGLVLMPVGAIVFVEHWIFPKLGLTRYWVSKSKRLLNWPAVIAWIAPLVLGFIASGLGLIHLFFLVVPVWILTSILYIVLSAFWGARQKFPDQGEPLPTPQTNSAASQESNPNRRSRSPWVYSPMVIAVLALLASLILAIWVTVAPSAEYDGRVEFFKTALVYLTAVYFASTIIGIMIRGKSSA